MANSLFSGLFHAARTARQVILPLSAWGPFGDPPPRRCRLSDSPAAAIARRSGCEYRRVGASGRAWVDGRGTRRECRGGHAAVVRFRSRGGRGDRTDMMVIFVPSAGSGPWDRRQHHDVGGPGSWHSFRKQVHLTHPDKRFPSLLAATFYPRLQGSAL